MNKQFTILITGASAGFGEATARVLAEAGHKLVLVARRKERLEKLAGELKTKVHIAGCDVTDRKAVERLFGELPPEFADIDVLVNNAGLALGSQPAPDANLDDWDRMVDTNIKGLMYVTRQALPRMTERGSGLIINIGSVSAFLPYRGSNVYGATKAFVRQFSRNLRADLSGTEVKVTNIEPGAARTEFSEVRFKGNRQQFEDYYQGWQPLEAEDIARTIAWVIDQPAHVNIDNVEVWPLDQTYGGAALNKKQ
ncbi:MAG TPA: SDR family NAD(P)-dependent oxidoreductase [Candidatus Saccharimonadia bacterium]|jgi:3-hydroxy acid dehydrogenase/malonic semialdehyde reductase